MVSKEDTHSADKPNSADVFLRFVIQRNHPESGVFLGVFGAAYELLDDNTTPHWDNERITALLCWFGENLARPTRFNRTKSKGHYHRSAKGISWLKSSAQDHISKMRELITLLESYGHVTEQIRTQRPGYIVYEDEYQIVAEPFSDTFQS
ncbi:hypothetical protein [Denitrobaculum tricleocarpae]|uniref:Uncharacterized protein n=1 Tax=Denitrobaculum tricleocarpae TaxID=2591009 RepID=A0A545T244_9PROT|nr:hypothetical protein [Denitrobaculum tricleocarpae]TQV71265.1 hypothetical protein FKG95_26895 [Denitrobaculum tricleocarpae]